MTVEEIVAHAANTLGKTLDESPERLVSMELNGHMVRIRGQLNDARKEAGMDAAAFAALVGQQLGRPVSGSLLRRGRPSLPREYARVLKGPWVGGGLSRFPAE